MTSPTFRSLAAAALVGAALASTVTAPAHAGITAGQVRNVDSSDGIQARDYRDGKTYVLLVLPGQVTSSATFDADLIVAPCQAGVLYRRLKWLPDPKLGHSKKLGKSAAVTAYVKGC